MRDEDDFNDMLHAALKSYAGVEPPPSLVGRIVTRAQQEPTRWRWTGWLGRITAVCGCAVALMAALLLMPLPRVQPLPMETAAPPGPRLAEPDLMRISTVASASFQRTTIKHQHRRRTYQPAPLSKQERLLLQFAMEYPEQARQVLAPPSSGAVHIAPITIAPLRIADIHTNDSQQQMDSQ